MGGSSSTEKTNERTLYVVFPPGDIYLEWFKPGVWIADADDVHVEGFGFRSEQLQVRSMTPDPGNTVTVEDIVRRVPHDKLLCVLDSNLECLWERPLLPAACA
jgi:hypothetical protein